MEFEFAEDENAEVMYNKVVKQIKTEQTAKPPEKTKWKEVVEIFKLTPCKMHVDTEGHTCRTCAALKLKIEAVVRSQVKETRETEKPKDILNSDPLQEEDFLVTDKTQHMNRLLIENVLSSDFFKERLLKCETPEQVFAINRISFDRFEPWRNQQSGEPSRFHCCVVKLAFLNTDFLTTQRMIDRKVAETRHLMEQLQSDMAEGQSGDKIGDFEEIAPEDIALGLIYLRLTLKFTKSWQVFSPFLEVRSKLKYGKMRQKISDMARCLLKDLNFQGLRLFRYPLILERKIKVMLHRKKLEEKQRRKRIKKKKRKEKGKGKGKGRRRRERREDSSSFSSEGSRSVSIKRKKKSKKRGKYRDQ